MTTRERVFRMLLLTVGVLLGTAAAVTYRASRPPAKHYDPVRVHLWKTKALPRIQASDEAAQATIARQVEEINAFFEQRKRNTRAFAEEVLSLSGKWNYLVSKLPWADQDRHRRYLEEKFREIIFSPD